jgi:aspartate ammonia-lyase
MGTDMAYTELQCGEGEAAVGGIGHLLHKLLAVVQTEGEFPCLGLAAEAGQLELNYAEPVLYHKLFESLVVLTGAIETFVDNCVVGITANAERCRELVDGSVGVITAICPKVGYKESAAIAKAAIATGKSVREVLLASGIMSAEEIDKLLDPGTMV